MRYHPALGFLVTQRENRIRRPANLERSGLLQVLALQKQLQASQSVKGGARQHRRPVNPWPDAFVCLHNGFPHNRGEPKFRVQIGRHDTWVSAYFRLRVTAKRCLRSWRSLAIARVIGILLSIHAPAHVQYSCSDGIPCRLHAIFPCLGRFLRGVSRWAQSLGGESSRHCDEIALTVLLASISWWFFEGPSLRLKTRFPWGSGLPAPRGTEAKPGVLSANSGCFAGRF